MIDIKRPAFRYHGAKFRLAPWVISHMPQHLKYVEPFGGAAGVLLQKPRVYAEVYNDLDEEVVNFFRVMQAPMLRDRLIEACQLTPYARAEFKLAFEHTDEPVERARRLAVRAGMGFGSAGATKGTTGFRIDTDRAYGTAMANWARYPDGLAAIGARFTGVLIENRPAIEVLEQHDTPDALHFVDPPYVHKTRVLSSGGRGYYRHEMTDDDHLDLLACLQRLRGMVMVCGYASEIYDQTLKGWHRVSTSARKSAARGTSKSTEVMWMNEAAAKHIAQDVGPLFMERAA
jgi:DNA adenine methylase